MKLRNVTNINRIGIEKHEGERWVKFKKKFTAPKTVDFAAIRIDSYGICGIYLNGEFVEASCGRFRGRIFYVECTSKIKAGENEIVLLSGDHYFENVAQRLKDERGSWFSDAALELTLKSGDTTETVVTDGTWECESDDGQTKVSCFTQITAAEYDRYWRAAALYEERRDRIIPEAVAATAGDGYVKYANDRLPEYVYPVGTVDENVENAVTYNFGRIYVGYVELEYDSDADGSVKLLFDYTEMTSDFEPGFRYPHIIERLALTYPIKKGHHTVMLPYRRAFRYMRVCFGNTVPKFTADGIRIRLSMMESRDVGYFRCPDELLNKAWEVGKYTLHVNKHQEYESCPRHEMKFFPGDAVVEALIDYYAFGDGRLFDASFGITEDRNCSGVRQRAIDRNDGLWEYPAWRNIMMYNHYLYFGDVELVKRYYGDLVLNIEWYAEKINNDGIIYQYPVFSGPFHEAAGSVEFTCSTARLGEKVMLNVICYRALVCMSELAKVVGDSRGSDFASLAEDIKTGINKHLWNEKLGAYVDTIDSDSVPQDGNAAALMFGVADKDRAKRIMKALEEKNHSPYGSALLSEYRPHTRGGNTVISPTTNGYEAEGRFLSGDADGAVDLMRRCYGTMINKGAETFWEFTHNDADTRWIIPAHGWGGGCTYLMSAFVLGIRPEKPGFEILRFEPYGGFESFTGVVPTPRGLVAVKCETVSGEKVYTLTVPAGMPVVSVIPADAKVTVTEYK